MRLEILERQIENDLDWREAELAIFRELLSHKETKTLRARALSRAAWSLLYAHYEGFSKFCLDLYLDFLAKRFSDCNTLPDRLFVFFIEKEIQKPEASRPTEFLIFLQKTSDR